MIRTLTNSTKSSERFENMGKEKYQKMAILQGFEKCGKRKVKKNSERKI